MHGNHGGVIQTKMTIYDVPNFTGGVDETLIQVATEVPSFIIGMLIFIFGVIFLGGSSTQKKRTGYADYPMWAIMGSLSILVVTLILTIKEGLINLETLGIIVAITILSGLWFFLSRGRGEI